MFSTAPYEVESVSSSETATLAETGDVSVEQQEEELDEDALLYGDSDKLFEEFKNAKQQEEKPATSKVRYLTLIRKN